MRKALGEAFLAQNVGDGLGLALLKFPDFFLDGARGDKAVGIDGAGLTNTMGTINRLSFAGS